MPLNTANSDRIYGSATATPRNQSLQSAKYRKDDIVGSLQLNHSQMNSTRPATSRGATPSSQFQAGNFSRIFSNQFSDKISVKKVKSVSIQSKINTNLDHLDEETKTKAVKYFDEISKRRKENRNLFQRSSMFIENCTDYVEDKRKGGFYEELADLKKQLFKELRAADQLITESGKDESNQSQTEFDRFKEFQNFKKKIVGFLTERIDNKAEVVSLFKDRIWAEKYFQQLTK